MLCSKKYTYPSVARVKRSVLDRVLFQFKLETPSYEWSHKLGHREVGGNFGIKFQNSIEGLFREYMQGRSVTLSVGRGWGWGAPSLRCELRARRCRDYCGVGWSGES